MLKTLRSVISKWYKLCLKRSDFVRIICVVVEGASEATASDIRLSSDFLISSIELSELSETSCWKHLRKLKNLTGRLIQLEKLEKKSPFGRFCALLRSFWFSTTFHYPGLYSKDFLPFKNFSSICNYNTLKKDTVKVTETKGLQTITKLWSLWGYNYQYSAYLQ